MKSIRNTLILLLVTILFIGCGNSSSTNSSTITGNVQKGPFSQGSEVKAYKLIDGVRSTTENKRTTTDDNKGSFSLPIPWTGPTEYEITGEYLDENTGNYLSDGLLTAVVNTQDNLAQKVNINIFTHIAAAKIKEMLKNGTSIDDASAEARTKIKEMFSLELLNDTKLEDLDLTDGMGSNKSDNTQLLKISAALLSSNDPDSSLNKLTELIDSNGDLNTEVLNTYNNILEKADKMNLFNIHNILKDKIGVSNSPSIETREGNLPFNHGLTFDTQVDMNINKSLISNYIVINNINNTAELKIENGLYSLNDGEFTDRIGTVKSTDSIKVKHNSSNTYGTEKVTTLNIGLTRINFKSITKADPNLNITTPNQFNFPIKINVPTSSSITSDEITISGLSDDAIAKVGISSGSSYEINSDGNWKSNTYENELSYSSVRNGDTIKVSNTASPSYGAKSVTTLTVGGVNADFIIYTREKDTSPNLDLFSPKTVVLADLGKEYITEYFLTSGYDGGLDIEVVNGEVQLEGETTWLSKISQIPTGYRVRFRQISSSDYKTSKKSVIKFGKSIINFETITKENPTIVSSKPDNIDFKTNFDTNFDSFVESEERIITGINGTVTSAYISEGAFMSVNDADWTNEPTDIGSGTKIKLRLKTSLDNNSSNVAHLYYGPDKRLFANFTVYNKKKDTQIDSIDFSNIEDAIVDTYYESNIVTIKGIDSSTNIKIVNGSFKINGGEWKTSSEKLLINVDSTLQLRHKSSQNINESVVTIVSFDTVQYKFKTTTANTAPTLIDTWTSDTIDENSNYSRKAIASDIENGVLTWSIESNPQWLSINSLTGELTGIPRQADVGIKENIKVIVHDNDELEDSFTFNLTVIDKNSDAQLLEISDKTINQNEELLVQIHASDLDGDNLIFNTQNVPLWMSFDSIEQILSGTPSHSDVGTYENITISVSDGNGSTRFESFKITVLNVNQAPTITSSDFTKEFILDDTSLTPTNYIFSFDVSDEDSDNSALEVIQTSVITEKRVGFIDRVHTYFGGNSLNCTNGKCEATISFAFPPIDDFHPSLKTRHTFTVSDGDKTASNYIDIWYAPTAPVLSGKILHTIEPRDNTSYESFSFIPTNSGNKARTWSINNKPDGFDFNTSIGEIKYSPLNKSLLLNDTVFKGIEITATNDRGTSEKFVFDILVKGKPAAPKFTFSDKTGVEIQQWFDSTITVNWLEEGVSKIVTSSGYLGQDIHFGFKINGVSGTSGTTSVQNGDKITAWHKSSNEYDTTLDTTITIGEDSDTFSTTTKESEATKLPLIVGAPNTRANVGEVYTYTPQLSTDYDNFAPITKDFTIENKPEWAIFDAVSGKLSGTPTQIGEDNQVRITAFGDNGLDDITFNITVSNDAPYINGSGHSLENPDLSFTFTDNSTWRNAITEVSMYGCHDESTAIILDPNDYIFSDGSLKLHSSTTTNAILRTPYIGGAGLIVKANNYPNSEAFIDMVQDGQYAVKVNILENSINSLIDETNINEAKINISLTNYLEFKDDILDISNFSLVQSPNGTFVKAIEYTNSTNAILTLGHNDVDFDEDSNIKINIANSELNICQDIESNIINVTAIVEVPWSNLLYPSTPSIDGHFGYSVDIKNETLAVLARSGVYIYTKDINGDYEENQKISAFSGSEILGGSIALDSDYLVVGNGNYYVENNGLEGRVEIYKKDINGYYNLLQDLTVQGLSDSAHFGASVDISGDLLLVGAYNDDNHKGAAYLFKNDGNDNFILKETIKRDTGKSMDGFAYDVAIDGNYFLIGSNVFSDLSSDPIDTKAELGAGFAYYYNYLNDTLALMEVLTPSDSSNVNDNFGQSVAISNDHIAIGSLNNNNKGSVYIYKRAFDTVSENGKIEGEIENEYFGFSVDIYHDITNTIAVGTAVYGNAYSITQSGTDFIKYKSTLEGITTTNGSDRLGYSVAIDNNEVAFGAFSNDDKSSNAGAVLVTNVGEAIIANQEDSIPHQFTFVDIINSNLDEIVSSSVTISGINQIVSVSIVNGEYSLDDGNTWQTQALTLENNQEVKVRHTSSSIYSTTVDTTLTVGTISDIFTSTTISEPLKVTPVITGAAEYSLENDDFSFSFTDDESWRNSINEVYYKAGVNNEYSLLKRSEYEITSGQIKLKIKDSTTVDLRTPYSINDANGFIKIIANGYEDNIQSIASVTSGKYAIKMENSPHLDNTTISESNLDGAKISIVLGNSLAFKDNILDSANFTLSLNPIGTSISSIEYSNSEVAIVTLAYDGTDFDTSKEINVVVNKNELNTNVTVSGKYPITVSAINEQAGGGTTSGRVIDPYIVNARFWYDLDSDTQEDLDELSSYSNENGEFSFNITVPEDGLIKMIEKGLHNGKVFTGNLTTKYSSSKQGLVSPITSISSLGFTDNEIISLLVNNGFDASLVAEELYLDPFDSLILLNSGDMSTATNEQKEKFRRVLLSNVIINSAIMSNSTAYDITKANLEDFFNAVYTVGGEGDFEGAPEDTTILKFLIALGNDILSNENLSTQAKIRARIFVTASEYASKRVRNIILEGGNPIWEFESIISEVQNMIYPLTYAYTKSLFNSISDPKFAWEEVDSNYRPILMLDNQILGTIKKITILYKDSSNTEQKIEFVRDNQDFIENNISSGQWIKQDNIIFASGKEFDIQGDKIIVNGEIFQIRDVITEKEDSSLENYYEELPLFESSTPNDNETYVDLNSNMVINYDKVLEAIQVNNTNCYITKVGELTGTLVSPTISGASIIYNPTEDLLYNQEYAFSCSISYGGQESYKSITFKTVPKPMPFAKTGEEEDFETNNGIDRVRNGNIVEDLNTGLMWNDDGINDTKSYSSANLYCKTLTVDVYTNWRLPTAREMQTLITFDGEFPLEMTNLSHFNYWTSTKSSDSTTWNSDEYIKVKFPNEIATEGEAIKSKTLCVRDSAALDESKIKELNWSDLSAESKTWEDANTYCDNLSGTWKLPNIQELLSTVGGKEVIDNTYPNSLNSTFQNSINDTYWSSTPKNDSNTQAYKMSARYGSINIGNKVDSYKVRCVSNF